MAISGSHFDAAKCLLQCDAILYPICSIEDDKLLRILPPEGRQEVESRSSHSGSAVSREVLEAVVGKFTYGPSINALSFRAGHELLVECLSSLSAESGEETRAAPSLWSMICNALPPEMVYHILSFKLEPIRRTKLLTKRAIRRILWLTPLPEAAELATKEPTNSNEDEHTV